MISPVGPIRAICIVWQLRGNFSVGFSSMTKIAVVSNWSSGGPSSSSGWVYSAKITSPGCACSHVIRTQLQPHHHFSSACRHSSVSSCLFIISSSRLGCPTAHVYIDLTALRIFRGFVQNGNFKQQRTLDIPDPRCIFIQIVLWVSTATVDQPSPTAIITAVAVALGVHLFVVFYEEPTLRRKFGADYEGYCRNVGRWWPRLRGSNRTQ